MMSEAVSINGKLFDCLIVGGGPVGLVAATYLGRFRRQVLLIDANESRANLIPTTFNCPGFPDGIAGKELLRRLRVQAVRYGAQIVDGHVEKLARKGGNFTAIPYGIQARSILIATGVADVLPDTPDLAALIASGGLRICPVCDAFEVVDKAVAVIGPLRDAAKKAVFLRTYTRSVVILTTDQGAEPEAGNKADGLSFEIVAVEPTSIRAMGSHVTVRSGGQLRAFDTIYPAMGCAVRSRLAADLGATCDNMGNLLTDAHQRTVIRGLYAAGDVVNELNQLAVGFGHAAIAASDIHDYLA